MQRLAMAITAAALASACNSPADIRVHCLTFAHQTVKVPELDSSNRQEMVNELYLRCLDRYGIEDVPVGGSDAP